MIKMEAVLPNLLNIEKEVVSFGGDDLFWAPGGGGGAHVADGIDFKQSDSPVEQFTKSRLRFCATYVSS